jgi:hypothetical protein
MTTEANRKRHQAYVNLDWRILAQAVVAEMEAEGHVVVRQASSSGSAAYSNAFVSSHFWYSCCPAKSMEQIANLSMWSFYRGLGWATCDRSPNIELISRARRIQSVY